MEELMENVYTNPPTNLLLLLKERIIKVETLLDKYACLTRKFNDLEKTHFQTLENEKKAKKDAATYLEKYCKLTKRCNCLVNKIKVLEFEVGEKQKSLEEIRNEYEKLESVLQIYKMERNGFQGLKKDKDFLLSLLWKILNESERVKDGTIVKNFFKRFEKDLEELKLGDFRNRKRKKISKCADEKSEKILLSSELQVLDSVESDFIDTDAPPESVKSANDEIDGYCDSEGNRELNVKPSDDRMSEKIGSCLYTDDSNYLLSPGFSSSCMPSDERMSGADEEVQSLENRFSETVSKSHSDNVSSLSVTGSDNSAGWQNKLFNEPGKTKGSDIHGNNGDLISNVESPLSLASCDNTTTLMNTKMRPARENITNNYVVDQGKDACFPSETEVTTNPLSLSRKKYANKTKCELPRTNILQGFNTNTPSDIDCLIVSSETLTLHTDTLTGDLKYPPDAMYSFEENLQEWNFSALREINRFEQDNCEKQPLLSLFAEKDVWPIYQPSKVDLQTSIFEPRDSCKGSIFAPPDSEASAKQNFSINRNSEEVQNRNKEVNINDRQINDGMGDVLESLSFKISQEDNIYANGILEEGNEPTNLRQNTEELEFETNLTLPLIKLGANDNSNIEHGTELSTSHSLLPFNEPSDEEVFKILKNFPNVRLLSPLKDKEHKSLVRFSEGKCPLQKNFEWNTKQLGQVNRNCPSQDRTLFGKKNEKLDKSLKSDSLGLEHTFIQAAPKVDRWIQTDTLMYPNSGNETLSRHDDKNERRKRISSVPSSLVRKIWKRELSKRFRRLKNFTKIWQYHSSCFDFIEMFSKIIIHCLKYGKCKTSGFCKRTKFSALKNKVNGRTERGKLSAWLVEDAKDTTENPIEHSPLFSVSSEKSNSCTGSDKISYLKGKTDSFVLPSGDVPEKNSNFDSFSSNENYLTETPKFSEMESDGHKYKNGTLPIMNEFTPNVTVPQCPPDIAPDSCKKESKITSMENCVLSSTSNDKLGIKNDISVFEVHANSGCYDAFKLDKDCEKEFECNKGKKIGIENKRACKNVGISNVVLRRSCRIQNQNKRLKLEENCSNSSDTLLSPGVSDSSSVCNSSFGNSTSSSHNDYLKGNEELERSFIGKYSDFDSSCNSEQCGRLSEKYKLLFGETESEFEMLESRNEPGIISGSCSKSLVPKGSKEMSTNFKDEICTKERRDGSLNLKTNKSTCRRTNVTLSDSVETVIRTHFIDPPYDYNDDGEGDDVKKGMNNKNAEISDTEGLRNESNNFLDSIMTAMTKQAETFKTIAPARSCDYKTKCECNPVKKFQFSLNNGCHREGTNDFQIRSHPVDNSSLPCEFELQREPERRGSENIARDTRKDLEMKKMVKKEINKFLKMDMTTVEEAEEKIKPCIAVLEMASEDIIANVVVAEVMMNVDEELQEFERPAPPLTKTQHRLMIILAVLSSARERFHKITNKILKLIWLKLFPETFFWPDDSVEMATRFYAALCKKLNNFKGIWKFCFKAITSMRQRWSIPIFVVLQVWPDILHNASEIQDNILVNTFVNVILHAPKTEEMRRKRQGEKLMALKHLIINFYNYQVNITIEEFTKKLLDLLFTDTSGSVDAAVLLFKCRNWPWARKNIVPKLVETLTGWADGKVPDITGQKILSILQQTASVIPAEDDMTSSSVSDVASALHRLLSFKILSQDTQEKIIKILCSLSHHSVVKDILLQLLRYIPSSVPIYMHVKEAIDSPRRKEKKRSTENSKTGKKQSVKLAKKKKAVKWRKSAKGKRKKKKVQSLQ